MRIPPQSTVSKSTAEKFIQGKFSLFSFSYGCLRASRLLKNTEATLCKGTTSPLLYVSLREGDCHGLGRDQGEIAIQVPLSNFPFKAPWLLLENWISGFGVEIG